MPFETLACTNCGSGDVQEVKPGTYFCNHCDSVFKHVDPTKLTVRPAFCEHGNPVTVQCQLCKSGMCSLGCDAVAAWLPTASGLRLLREIAIVRTQGFGYYSADGPYLGLGKLLKSLAIAHRINLNHVCYDCVIGAVPIAAEYIAAGAICQTASCVETNTIRCPCCRGFFCNRCIERLPARTPGGLVNIFVGDTALYRLADYVHWGRGDLCNPCLRENEPKATAIALSICRQDYAGRLIPHVDNGFKLDAPRLRKGRKWAEDLKRQQEIAAQYAAEITERVNQRMVLNGDCNCQKPPTVVAIVDERNRVAPAAISPVLRHSRG